MIPCRIIVNQLPPEVLDAVLRTDEVKENDPCWQLLRSGNTRRTYHYQPEQGKPSWIVKWGCRYTSLKKITGALTGRDQATLEWEKTKKAEECGLPVVPFSLLAVPKIQSGRLYSLLVSPYLEKSQNLIQFLSEQLDHPSLIQETLTQLGRIVSEIHEHDLLHRDLSLDNVLIQENDPWKLVIIDWFKMWSLPKRDNEKHWMDLIAPLCDMIYTGVPESQRTAFLEGYAEKGRWLQGRFQEMLDKAKEARIGIIRRAWKNCNWKSRGVIRYRYRGYSVYLLKGQDRETTNRFIDSEINQPFPKTQSKSKEKDSEALERWRCANALRASGAIGHPVVSYAVRKRFSQIHEILVEEKQVPEDPVRGFLDSASPESRRKMLRDSGYFLRRLHEVEMGVQAVSFEHWWVQSCQDKRFRFFTDNLDAIIPMQCKTFEERFAWVKNPDLQSLGIKSLLEFMKGYSEGHLDRPLIRQIIGLQ